MSRWLLMIAVVVSGGALAAAPCSLKGDGELPAGTLWVDGVALARTAAFESRHRITIEMVAGDFTAPRAVRLENEQVTLEMMLAAKEPLAAVMKRGGLRFGVWVPGQSADTLVVGVDQEGLQLEFRDLPRFKGTPPSGHAPCSAVELRGNRRGSPEPKEPPGALVMLAVGEIPITATFDGPRLGSLVAPEDAVGVMLTTREQRAHLVWSTNGGAFDGWVPSNALSFFHGAVGAGGGSLEGKASPMIELSTEDSVRCASPVPLYARVDGRRLKLGTLAARVPFVRTNDDAIELGFEGLKWLPGVELTIDWATCREVKK